MCGWDVGNVMAHDIFLLLSSLMYINIPNSLSVLQNTCLKCSEQLSVYLEKAQWICLGVMFLFFFHWLMREPLIFLNIWNLVLCWKLFFCVSEHITEAELKVAMKRQLQQSKQKENLCWHAAATRRPVNANFNKTLIIGVRALLNHFVLCVQ